MIPQHVRMTRLANEQDGRQSFLDAYDAKLAALKLQTQQESDSDLQRRAAMTLSR